jgi:hypothetical protein
LGGLCSNTSSLFEGRPITLLEDDLYSRQPMAEYSLEHNFNFIFVCLPTSHTALYDWLSFLEANGEVKTTQQRRWNGRYFEIWDYRYRVGILAVINVCPKRITPVYQNSRTKKR